MLLHNLLLQIPLKCIVKFLQLIITSCQVSLLPQCILKVGLSQQMVEENTSSPMYMQSCDNGMKPIVRVDLARVSDSVVMIVENYVDILPSNDDDNVKLFD